MLPPWNPVVFRIVCEIALLTIILRFSVNNFNNDEIRIIGCFGLFLGIAHGLSILIPLLLKRKLK